MKFVVFGNSQTNRSGSETTVFGPGGNEVVKQFTQAKAEKSYPDGVVRLDLCKCETIETGILIVSETPKQKSKKEKSK